uniref:PPUP9124 n=1 Tax=Poeciliopsis prolifica TaxID=188132 RepID=A0A0S7EJD9_9TELE
MPPADIFMLTQRMSCLPSMTRSKLEEDEIFKPKNTAKHMQSMVVASCYRTENYCISNFSTSSMLVLHHVSKHWNPKIGLEMKNMGKHYPSKQVLTSTHL